MLPKDRVRHGLPFHLLGWGILALSMSLAVAGLIVAHITRPLRILAEAARRVGQQQDPFLLPSQGPTEVQQVMSAFNRMSDDLREHESERAEVLAGISHDLRTPLARLRLEAELNLVDEQSRQAVVADIEQMDSIIAQFLDYARSEDGEPATECDIVDLLHELAEHASALGKPIELSIPADFPDNFTASFPAKALRRSLQNLLENAWKYGQDESTGTSSVTLAVALDGQTLILSVRDHGQGIPEGSEEFLKRAFKRIDTARTNASGTGLGLAIVDRFARRQGGCLSLDNHPKGGLIAQIKLPNRLG